MKLDFITEDKKMSAVPEEPATDVLGRPIYFRRSFSVDTALQATLHITALGEYEVYLDGKKIGEDFLSPGWTDYATRIYYDTFTLNLTPGKHALTAVVAGGWYSGNVGGVGPGKYSDIVALGAKLCFENGSEIVTDKKWRVGVGGYLYADNIMGEWFDASLEPEGWKLPDFDDSAWNDAIPVWQYAMGALILPREHEPVRAHQRIPAVSESRDSHGNYIYDLGQNMTGVVHVRFMGKKGSKLQLRHGEMLDNGNLYTENLRTARQTDVYIPAADGECEYMPRFTFHGFRYVESNLPLSFIEGVVLYSDCKQTGHIETSSLLVNRIFQNQLWGQRSNFVDVPTDCPQRNERMGWTGDAQIFARTGMYNMRSDKFYRKYMTDLRDAMLPDGSVTNVVPQVWLEPGRSLTGTGTPAWGDAVFVIPYHHWKIYGDTQILKENYAAMKRYFEFLKAREENHLQLISGFGDWLNADSPTNQYLLSTAYYAYDALLLSEIAEALGHSEDSEYYKSKYALIKDAFINEFADSDGRLTGDTQCAYVLALYFGLYADREKTISHLVRTIRERNNHLTTGFIGTAYLLPVLSEAGYTDLAYTLLLNDTYPSWGYCIRMGATTMWERWNSYTEENGFGDKGMNSFNHYSFGAVAQWMYEYMAGIRPLTPGYKHFAVAPHMDSRVPGVSMTYESVNGEISVKYNTTDGKLTLTVPDGCTADVTLDGKTTALTGGMHTLEFKPII